MPSFFGRESKAQIAEKEAERKRIEEEQQKRAAEEKAAEQRRVIEETRKKMEEKKAQKKAAEETGEEPKSKSPMAKSKISRVGGISAGESADINAQIAAKMARIKGREAQKKKEAEEAKERARQEAIARGETPEMPTVGQLKWGTVQSKLGSAALRLKAMDAERNAQNALRLKAMSSDDDAAEAQRILAAQACLPPTHARSPSRLSTRHVLAGGPACLACYPCKLRPPRAVMSGICAAGTG